MSRYLIATIEVKSSGRALFAQTMGVMQSILTAAGWKLAAAYSLRTGLLGTVIDVWELGDFDQVDVGFAALAQDPRWPDLQAALAETIVRETLAFADSLTYPAPPE